MSLHELSDLVLRWVHLIAGIMWIGNSMLFNWLDRNLVKPPEKDRPGFEGEMWMVHSGGFYQVEKKLLRPHELPPQLHWFKWQNGVTWMSGIALLIVVYYLQADAFMVDSGAQFVTPAGAVGLGILTIVVGWILYDLLWSLLDTYPTAAAAVSFALLGTIAWGLCQIMSGRAAYLHVGVLLGTLMTGNVWLHILPSQRQLVASTKAGQPQDARLGKAAKSRSIHNNYMTFPLLFIMLSTHFPSTYGSPINWIVLFALMIGGAGVRHFMNVRFGRTAARWLLPAAAIAVLSLGTVYALTARRAPAPAAGGPATFAQAEAIIASRCRACHSANPTDKIFAVPPSGIIMDTPEQIGRLATRIQLRAVEQRTMPFANRTNMTDEERGVLGRWIAAGAPTK